MAMLAQLTHHEQVNLAPRISDVSLTPGRIRLSDSSKGTTRSDSDQKKRIRGFGFMNMQNRIHESESDLLIPRHLDSDSESLIRIHNLRRGYVSLWNMNDTSFGVMNAYKVFREELESMIRFD
ncbi:hypothetical protein AVEN_247276-1 [Araneus ventricosus]|uniref:Uncharacterized protein n=1 Tax=Araneus ventricosus TaxID=182803 RepID=A0A4Y2WZD2_ARAVE|nr:hypothetical protein AVEN_247276-1 [Araneus ventricosus]